MRSLLKSWRARARLLWRLSWADRLLLAETCLFLGVARALVLIVPFGKLAPHLDKVNGERPEVVAEEEIIRRVARAIWLVSRHTPWRSNCMAQALAGKTLLARRGLSSTLYLGVAKEGEQMAAHAWLRCGPRILTGAAGHERYTVITTFGDKR
jgi:hypothetical protein